MNASVADVASLAVEVRQLRQRVATLEAKMRHSRRAVLGLPRLADRVLALAAKRDVFAGRDLIRALDAEGMLSEYRHPRHTAWAAITREAQRGTLRRVGRGYYKIVLEEIAQ